MLAKIAATAPAASIPFEELRIHSLRLSWLPADASTKFRWPSLSWFK
jgi:hypothetical protein